MIITTTLPPLTLTDLKQTTHTLDLANYQGHWTNGRYITLQFNGAHYITITPHEYDRIRPQLLDFVALRNEAHRQTSLHDRLDDLESNTYQDPYR